MCLVLVLIPLDTIGVLEDSRTVQVCARLEAASTATVTSAEFSITLIAREMSPGEMQQSTMF